MSYLLPVQIRDLVTVMHRETALLYNPSLLKSNDFKRDARFLRECPQEAILKDLPICGKEFNRLLALGDEESFSFGAVDGLSLPLPDRLFNYYLEGVRVRSWAAVRALRQVLDLLSKLETPTPIDPQDAIASWVRRNASLPTEMPESQLIRNASAVNAILLWGIDLRDIKPRHGPGAVASREKPWAKMGFGHMFKSMEGEYPYTDYMFLNYTHLCDELASLDKVVEKDYPVTRLVAVPKDFRGPRLISVEPLETQWIQQGQARALMDRLEQHPLSRGHVNFASQEVNRTLALLSSESGQFATIDLKDASDRVSTSLVRAILPKGVLKLLEASRSHATLLPQNAEVELRMFAPMGSAVCFPLESLVFYSVIIGALQRQDSQKRSPTHEDVKRHMRHVFVYGDDIIIKTEHFDLVMQALEEVGLQVNLNKCCAGPRFRESCGMDAYDGQDVTPVRLKHYPCRSTPVSLASSCDYINRLNELGLVRCSSFLERWTSREFGPIPRSARDLPLTIRVSHSAEAGLYNHEHFKDRKNPGLQCYEYKVPVLAYSYAKSRLPSWSEAFRAILMNTQANARGYPVPHRVRLTTRWRIMN